MNHLTYLLFELGWALPVLVLQWVVGGRVLWHHRYVLLMGLTVTTVYLSLTDAVAIANGIWNFPTDRILGLHLGDLPIEEVFFFLLTNCMVVQAIILAQNIEQIGIVQVVGRKIGRR